ncbi:MAG TPA: hypothetical protein VHU24_08740 [Solirubrobacterales bacterium]|jgi:hypothetical protein|nr:hypothetical protein [Solirubrobacterales bacterium]
MSDSLRRLAPLTGIVFAVLLVVTFATPSTPGVHDTGAQVIAHYNKHHSAHLIGDLAGGVGVVFFLFFISSLRSFFRDKEGADGLSRAAFAGGILIAVGGAVFTSLDVALVDARHDITPQAAQALNVLSNDFFFPFEIGLVVFALCTGLTIIASGALPKWLGWVMIVIGIVAFSPVGFFGFFVVMIWSVIVAILIYRRSGAPAPATA